ncbi:uncharacterized protein LOC124862493 [Girardinichthys multiradiatus]|uniref:uncharacterized protein LOC124862493 n=1 Tax=Girardinichthys multiradiatus TaxID=208333 RepID=UPI001FAE5AD1|nr:uncharacterized protein LOC124862493 [Girardinichthys multiradiatus]
MSRLQWAEADFDPPPGAFRLLTPQPDDNRTYIMYHGTTQTSAQGILKNGFHQSQGGMLGPGVYLSRDLEKASRYPIDHPEWDKVVIKVKVNVGKVKAINYQNHPLQKTWHDKGYDTAWVPPNCGMVKSGLEENCVWDPSRIEIIQFIRPTAVQPGYCMDSDTNMRRLQWTEADFDLPIGILRLLTLLPADKRTYIMYHGTTQSRAQSILANGFRQSQGGMLGPGVYLSRDLEKASRYPIGHPEWDKVVIKVKVNVGRVKVINRKNHPLQMTWHYYGYDTAWVPPNCGMVNSGLEENCVWDPRRIEIIQLIRPTVNPVQLAFQILHIVTHESVPHQSLNPLKIKWLRTSQLDSMWFHKQDKQYRVTTASIRFLLRWMLLLRFEDFLERSFLRQLLSVSLLLLGLLLPSYPVARQPIAHLPVHPQPAVALPSGSVTTSSIGFLPRWLVFHQFDDFLERSFLSSTELEKRENLLKSVFLLEFKRNWIKLIDKRLRFFNRDSDSNMSRLQWAEADFDPPPGAFRLLTPQPDDNRTYIMYHGTTQTSAQGILKNGFHQSQGGMLGPGVYLSRDLEKASRYPIDHPEWDKVVIKVKVNVGKVKAINYQNHPLQKTWHDKGYDTAWVPPNCGMVKSGLEENCVWDPSRIEIIEFIRPTAVQPGYCM